MLRIPLAASMVCLVAAAASAQPLSFSRTDVASNTGARGIATADFDGNGWPDVAQANTGRNTVTVLLNHVNGAVGLKRAYEVAVGTGPFDIVAADFNRDNVPDLAVANADNDTISILLGRRGGGVASQVVLAAPGNPRGITAADMNRDGKPDIVYTTYAQKAIRILLGNGAGGFTQSASFTPDQSFPQGVTTADIDRDGALDVIVAYTNHTGLAIYYGNGLGGFTGGGSTTPVLPSINVVTTADFNRDGWIDIAAASTSGNQVAVYLLGPNGSAHLYAVGSSPRGIAVADLNQDGTLDLITANRASNAVSILLGRPASPGSFSAATSVAAGSGSRDVVTADFDQDGLLDLATGNELAASATLLTNQIVLPPSAYGFDAQPLPNSANDGWNVIETADFNRNGKPDFVLPGRVVLDGGASVTTLPGPGAGDYAVGDFNRDGRPDIARIVEYSTPMRIEVLLGDGAGAFSQSWSTTFIGSSLFAVDLNRDGVTDIVVSGWVDSATAVQSFIGNGNGTFTAKPARPTGSTSSLMDLADVNGDGKLDAVFVQTVLGGDTTVRFLYGDGQGGFAAPIDQPIAGAFYGDTPRVADFNHDGVMDLAVANFEGILVLLGQPGGGFSAPSKFPTTNYQGRSPSPYRFQVVDLNQDGNLDLVFESVLWGRGDGTFEPGELQLVWNAKVFADVNNDGALDIVASLYDSAEVLRNLRTNVNRPPTLTPLTDVSLSYIYIFENDADEQCVGVCATATDPDLHLLDYIWTDDAGRIVGHGPFFSPRNLAPGTHHLTLTVRDGRGGETSDTMTLTISPFPEIVTDGYSECCGAWRPVDDATAGEASRMYHPNANAPKVVTALANPTNYFEIVFTADPTQTYKLWVRLKADGNAPGNDSIHLQFAGATDTAGTPVYRIGTTSSLEINLEECVGCGESGWGWRDERWGPSLGTAPVLLRFPAGGRQTLRIQTREDGVSVDQIVLSANTYKASAPGPAKNDTHILPRTTYQYY